MPNNLSSNKWLVVLVAANFSALAEAFSVSNPHSVTRHSRPRLLVPPLYNGEDSEDTEDGKAFDQELDLGELTNELERSKNEDID